MRKLMPFGVLFVVLGAMLAVSISTPKPADAAIHEILAALCNGGVGQGDFGEVEPPGIVKGGKSFLRPLIATGFIVSIDTFDPGETVITFDVTGALF